MRLTELEPKYGAEEGEINRVIFNCPKCQQHKIAVPIPPDRNAWQISGDSFDNLTLKPSIDSGGGWYDENNGWHPCRWHGFVTNGEILTV